MYTGAWPLRLPMMVASRLFRYSTSLDSAATYCVEANDLRQKADSQKLPCVKPHPIRGAYQINDLLQVPCTLRRALLAVLTFMIT